MLVKTAVNCTFLRLLIFQCAVVCNLETATQFLTDLFNDLEKKVDGHAMLSKLLEQSVEEKKARPYNTTAE